MKGAFSDSLADLGEPSGEAGGSWDSSWGQSCWWQLCWELDLLKQHWPCQMPFWNVPSSLIAPGTWLCPPAGQHQPQAPAELWRQLNRDQSHPLEGTSTSRTAQDMVSQLTGPKSSPTHQLSHVVGPATTGPSKGTHRADSSGDQREVCCRAPIQCHYMTSPIRPKLKNVTNPPTTVNTEN